MLPDEKSLEAYAARMKEPAPGGFFSLPLKDRGDGWCVIGAVADKHLCSKHYRADVLKTLYRIYADEGVTDVYDAGNWIEGEAYFNRHDISVFGLDAQIEYFIQEHPHIPGITTHFVAGDDHEGWYQQREQISIGKHLEQRAKAAGRDDFHFLGYVEADVYLKTPLGAAARLKVMHGGGGATYAVSYQAQKAVEALQPGEKPDILILGHHHKLLYFYPRGVHVVLPGCTADQSIHMRKRHIEAHVGGAVLYIRQHLGKGFVTEFVPRFKTFFDRSFTQRYYDVP